MKKLVWILCSIPFCYLAIQTLSLSPNNALFWKQSLVICGYTAAGLLALTLCAAPMHKHLPQSHLFTVLNQRKREIGLSSFFYAVIHAFSYFIKKSITTGQLPWKFLLHPVILPGILALVILLILALTSFNYWIKKLTWTKWKTLHRAVYIAEAAVFLHMVLRGGMVAIWGSLIFIPLLICQRLRLNRA